jgi:sialidase-1
MKKGIFFLTVLMMGVLSSCRGNDDPAPKPDPTPDPDPTPELFIYKQGTFGYELYRIPALIKSKSNTLLAFAEARKSRSNGDSGDIDLVVKRSTDDGITWSDMIMIWDEGTNTCGNPVPIVDRTTGRIHLLMTWNNGADKWGDIVNGRGIDTRRPYYTYSDDDGLTWYRPVEITSSIKKHTWDWYGTGPVHGIQIQNGQYKGRLVSPNYFTMRVGGQEKHHSHIAYSDNNGQTWIAGEPTTSVNDVGECSVAELPDGTLMLNMRTDEGFYRKSSISTDGGHTWSEVKTETGLTDPKCHGSIISLGQNLFLSNAAAATRTTMTITQSEDNGSSWTKKYLVYEGPSAYSDILILSDTQIAIFYERGEVRYTDGLAFEIINVNKLN